MNPELGLGYVAGVCNILGSVSLQQKFEVMGRWVLQPRVNFLSCRKIWSDVRTTVRAPCHSSVLFRNQRKIHRWVMRAGQPKRQGEERLQVQFWLLFLCFFLFPLTLPHVNWANQEGCLFYLRSPLWSSDLLLFYFCGLLCLLATAILDSFSLFYLPNSINRQYLNRPKTRIDKN